MDFVTALLDRLRDICSLNPEDFNSSYADKQGYRYHAIDWNATNIPISRRELDWVDPNIIRNEEEFPFYQFQISNANGRIVGFWDVKQTVFHIVLLDPKHNIQPAGGKFKYRVDRTSLLPCKYSSLMVDIDRLKSKKYFCEKCTFKSELTVLQDKYNVGNYVYFQLDDDFYTEFKTRIQDKSIGEVVELWLIKD